MSQFEYTLYTMWLWWCLKCDIKSKYKKVQKKNGERS